MRLQSRLGWRKMRTRILCWGRNIDQMICGECSKQNLGTHW